MFEDSVAKMVCFAPRLGHRVSVSTHSFCDRFGAPGLQNDVLGDVFRTNNVICDVFGALGLQHAVFCNAFGTPCLQHGVFATWFVAPGFQNVTFGYVVGTPLLSAGQPLPLKRCPPLCNTPRCWYPWPRPGKRSADSKQEIA